MTGGLTNHQHHRHDDRRRALRHRYRARDPYESGRRIGIRDTRGPIHAIGAAAPAGTILTHADHPMRRTPHREFGSTPPTPYPVFSCASC